jgi:hypothetical protein
MYACVVKNSENTWDIYGFTSYPTAPDKQANLEAAVESGLPITGMILTPYKWSATNGATFDGTEFTGGSPSLISLESDWTGISTYGYLCNNTIIAGFIANVGSVKREQMEAIFSEETTIIKVPEGQTANIGDVWDGTNIITRA